MRATRRLLPAAVFLVSLLTGLSAEVGAQALDSAGVGAADPVALPLPEEEARAQTPLEPLVGVGAADGRR